MKKLKLQKAAIKGLRAGRTYNRVRGSEIWALICRWAEKELTQLFARRSEG